MLDFLFRSMIILFLFHPGSSEAENQYILEFRIVGANTQKPVEANVTIYHNSDIEIYKTLRTTNGVLRDSTEKHGWFVIEIDSDAHFRYTDTLWITETTQPMIRREYSLQPITAGEKFVFHDLKFYFNSFDLKTQSVNTVDSIAHFLRENPSIAIEVAGHTDDEGPAEYNLTLSQGRAEAIVKLLIRRGIAAERLIPVGYGEEKPLDNGITKAAKARNRRVELTITKRAENDSRNGS